MPSFHIAPLDDPMLSTIVFRWNLDSPKDGETLPSESGSSPCLRGWAIALGENQSQLYIVFRFKDRTLASPLNRDREDVVQHFFKEDPEGKKYIRCGFEYPLDFSDAEAGFEIGFEVDGIIRKASRVFLRIP
jgi:hypothetical protein